MNVKKIISVIMINAFILSMLPANVFALPKDAEVVVGEAEFTYIDPQTLRIDAGDKTIINYQSFNINENESVLINLPSVNSSILNRITGGEASNILGILSCNGMLVLVNENGFYFGPEAVINSASLIASMRDITDSDFLSNEYIFRKYSEQMQELLLVNDGTIIIEEGGFGVLIAGGIENNGSIIASLGKIVLAGADAVRLDIGAGGLLGVAIEEAAAANIIDQQGNAVIDQIKNNGVLEGNGGLVMIDAQCLPGIFEKAINLNGVLRANQVENKDGTITLSSSGLIYSQAEIKALGGTINIHSDSDVTSIGVLRAKELNETGASFKVGGIFEIGKSYLENEDGAALLTTGTYSGETADIEHLIIDDDAIITLSGSTIFRCDSDTNGSGAFTMNLGSSIVGAGNDLSLFASENSTLRSITGIGTLTLNESQAASNPIYTANNDMDLGGFNLASGTFTAPSILTVNNGLTVNTGAVFTHNNGTVKFFINDTNYIIDADGTHFFDVEFNKSSGTTHTATINNDFSIDGDLTLTRSAANDYNVHTPAGTNVDLTVLGDLIIPDDGLSGGICFGTNDPTHNTTIDLAGPTSSFEMHDSGAHFYSNVKFSGTGTQDINKTTGYIKYNIAWTIDKPSGEVRLVNGFSMYNSDNYLYLNNGTLNLNGCGLSSIRNFIQNGGTFNGTNSSISLEHYTLNGGTFNSTSSILNINRGFTINAGTFNHSNGEVRFFGNDYSYDIDAGGAHFHNVEFHKCGSSDQTLTLLDDFTVENDLEVYDHSCGEDSLTIRGQSSPTITVQGDLIFASNGGIGDAIFGDSANNFSVDLAGATSSLNLADSDAHLNANILFTGSGDQNITQAGAVDSGTWTVDKSSGKVILLTDVNSLAGLTLDAGEIDLNTNSFTGEDYTQSGGIFTSSTGSVGFNSFSQSAGTFTAPLGTLSIGGNFSYSGGTFTHNNGTVSFTAVDTDNTITTAGAALNNVVFNGNGGEWALQDGLTLSGNLTISHGGLNLNGKDLSLGAAFSNDSILKLNGQETLTGFTNDTDSGTVEYAGSGTYASLIAGDEYYNLNVSGTGSFTANSDVIINNNFIQSNGTFNAPSGNMSVGGDLSQSSGVFNASSGTLNLSGNLTTTGGTFTHNDGIVVFNAGDTDNTITASGWTFKDISFNNSSGKWTLQEALQAEGNLSIDAGTLDLNGKVLSLNAASVFNNEGTLLLDGDEVLTNFTADTDSGIIEYTGSGSYASLSGGNDYYDLVISGSGTFTADADVTVANDFQQSAGTFNAPSGSMSIGGDFNHTAGNFIHNNGEMVFNGTDQSLNGSTVFYDFSKSISGSITFDSSACQTFEGILTLKGIDVENRLVLKSDIPGQQWQIDYQGNASDLSYLDVRDMNNIGKALYASSSIFSGSTGCSEPVNISDSELENATKETWEHTFDVFNNEVDLEVSSNIIIPTGRQLIGQEPQTQINISEKGNDSEKQASLQEMESVIDNEIAESADEGQHSSQDDIKSTDAQTSKEGFNNDPYFQDKTQKYKKPYKSGKYRTVVIVFEGKVIVSPYDQKGPVRSSQTSVSAGEHTQSKGNIK